MVIEMYMRSSYNTDDVKILLKDITGLVAPQSAQERERLIQSGRHYSEMLPIEYRPSEKYMEAYRQALKHYAKPVADATAVLAKKIIRRRGGSVVLVSLARAGIPIGVLLKRYLKKYYNINAEHYAVSIIKGRGIDDNAMRYILSRHKAQELQFVDGWIGKGAIFGELEKCVGAYEGVSGELAVIADPAGVTDLCGTHEDILIPSSCLNCTVSGLISRTFLRSDIIGEKDFHGAVYYGELADEDLSYDFIDAIEKRFDFPPTHEENDISVTFGGKISGIDEVKRIAEFFSVDDINLIKPSIGEATRVLLRRVPWKVLINERDKNDEALAHLLRLAEEKKVSVEYYPLVNYKACGIIRKMAEM